MKLLFIRHAQSANNKLFYDSGADAGRSADPDITELGQRQAEALARRLTDGSYPRITHLYTSLMRRTIQTAAPLADALDLPITARLDTHEVPGPYDGPFADRLVHRGSPRSFLQGLSVRVSLPEVATEEGWFHRELEDFDEPYERARVLLQDLQATHQPDDVVAVVSHGAFGGVLLGTALGTSRDVWYAHHNTATSLVTWQAASAQEDSTRPDAVGAVMLQWQNRVDHLGDLDRT